MISISRSTGLFVVWSGYRKQNSWESEQIVVDEAQLVTLAAHYQINPVALRDLLVELQTQAGGGSFYIFWNSSSSGAAPPTPPQRSRTLVAFPTPDMALAFAQHNRMVLPGQPARLRRLTLLQLFAALLREVRIEMLLLVTAEDTSIVAGRLPEGVTVARAMIVDRLGIV